MKELFRYVKSQSGYNLTGIILSGSDARKLIKRRCA